MTVRLSTLTTEYVRVPFAAQDDTAQPIDPTSYDVDFALIAAGTNPAAGDWTAGEWETSQQVMVTLAGRTVATVYKARTLIGPEGTLEREPGRWRLWIRVAADPELIVADVDEVVIV